MSWDAMTMSGSAEVVYVCNQAGGRGPFGRIIALQMDTQKLETSIEHILP